MFYCGIDIAKYKHEASVIDMSDKALIDSISFANDKQDCEKDLAVFEKFEILPDDVIIGMEAIGHYWLSVYTFFLELGYTVKVINPIQSEAFRKMYIPVAERYACLLGSAIDGNKRLHNVQEVAEFICKHGQYGDVRITTMEGKELLDTFGIYINKISDMEYREELLKVLIPMQHEVENAAFSDDEDMDETEDVNMTM